MTRHFKSNASYKRWLRAKWAITGRTKKREKVIIAGKEHKVEH